MANLNEIFRRLWGHNPVLQVVDPEPQQVPLYQQTQVVEEYNPQLKPKITLELEPPRVVPTTTAQYMDRWCGTTYNDIIMTGSTGNWVGMTETKLDEKPLKHFLMKKFKWIEDVTEVSTQRGGVTEVHLTVSPIHHSELMIPSVEKVVREKLYDELTPLITCMYEDTGKQKPRVIFSPSHSETILEHFK